MPAGRSALVRLHPMARRSISRRSRRGLIGLRSLIASVIAFAAVAYAYREAVKRVVNKAIAESTKAPFDIQSEIGGPLKFNNFDSQSLNLSPSGLSPNWRPR